MKKIAAVSARDTDLINIIRLAGNSVDVIKQEAMETAGLASYDAVMFCGGTDGQPMKFTVPQWDILLGMYIKKSPKLFAEFCPYFGVIKCSGPDSTRYMRPAAADNIRIEGIECGDLFDEQSNMRLSPYSMPLNARVWLNYYKNPRGFYKLDGSVGSTPDSPALFSADDFLLFCAFRISDFCSARFAPKGKWFELVRGIIGWMGGEKPELSLLSGYYDSHAYYTVPCGEDEFEARASEGVDRVFAWIRNAGMLAKRGDSYYAISEGLLASVYHDGSQDRGALRNDSTGETSFLYFMKYLQTGDKKFCEISEQLSVLGKQLITSYDNSLDGFGCWNLESAYTVCYQDDTARGFLLPHLYRMLYTGDRKDEKIVRRSLDFLLRTTSGNGLRSPRTDIVSFDPPLLTAWGQQGCLSPEELGKTAEGTPSAHYNGTYMASLLLAYKIFGDERYLNTAVRGMTSFMKIYPETVREHSETQEYCRLILPLALLYWATGEQTHKEWLYRVTADLEKFRQPDGSFVEWDTGYRASCAGVVGGESSVLCENGNPVVDMLYSINWLPSAFAQAYLITEDEKFRVLWRDICRFLLSVQIRSHNKMIDGVWTRAFDVSLNEVYGVPNDVGWAPWSVECGWTMGEIPVGILMGLMSDSLRKFYR